ncbi:MAG: saccharopine dehydrogenase NADP-binding domain-containing protein [candidate division KSB1 bacterium]|nr:saccharopine dehydrogenase NADP-binding domain-containing protein [candidate division KSB1 bacterium]MDZ7272672.1 saccharopine dehydrogenase NADP-binding domain-containing protein [candidate division KSB1 bacterium]MDZ7284306.1 saccharopine dehydrogenase NADP-binding domain-containing protein [candidate division KSB1 bacterium]MDZ7297298.1 saccharopine dehydrogenase NADP-binding domain-containing protein [candidate division KSB1 bacterium]MDZ7309028.1 saccharopine dehydrogenase NADP-binding 
MTSATPAWLLYGANGYTGDLTARLAFARGLRPILAGRNAGAIRRLARELGLEYRIFTLNDSGMIHAHLQGLTAVLHMAGPFSATSQPMRAACLQARVHYLDITGEISVFEATFACHEQARQAGIVLLPGVGLDVVPSDCLAAMLKKRLPDATHLELAFGGTGRSSRGTIKTAIEALPGGSRVRHNGEIIAVPFGWQTRRLPFPQGSRMGISIPWGDVSTAFHTTGIPNICVYTAVPPALLGRLRWLNRIAPLTRPALVQWLLKAVAAAGTRELTPAERQQCFSVIWGEVRNAAGRTVSAALTTPEGYTFTAEAALAALAAVLAQRVRPGAWTPAAALGADFILTLPGVKLHDFTESGPAGAHAGGLS